MQACEKKSLYPVSTGRYLYNALGTDLAGDHEVAFVWNRSEDKMLDAVPQHLVLRDLGEVGSMSPDLIVEVAHPSVVAEFGQLLLQTADFMVSISLYLSSIYYSKQNACTKLYILVKAERI